MIAVSQWTGHEARLLRQALRMSVRGFADFLGVSARTVSKWESGGAQLTPRPDSQAILDTALQRAPQHTRERFERTLPSSPPGWNTTVTPVRGQPRSEDHEVHLLLAHAAQVAMGINDSTVLEDWAIAHEPKPERDRVSLADIEQIEHVTAGLRALDYQLGGGACRDAVLAQTHGVARLLNARASDDVRRRIHLSLADLHNLTGWTSLDIGLYSASRFHFAHALTHSRRAEEPSLLANVLYRTGRLHLHCRMIREALRFFQLGQIAAQDSGDALAVAVLCANEAWAYAIGGDQAQAARSIHRAADELARAEPATAAPWVRFFGPTDLDAVTGITHLELSTVDRTAHLGPAIQALTSAVAARDGQQARSRAFEVTALATAVLKAGEVEAGLALGRDAVTTAQQLSSRRVLDRLEPLALEAARTATIDGDQLAHTIATLRSV